MFACNLPPFPHPLFVPFYFQYSVQPCSWRAFGYIEGFTKNKKDLFKSNWGRERALPNSRPRCRTFESSGRAEKLATQCPDRKLVKKTRWMILTSQQWSWWVTWHVPSDQSSLTYIRGPLMVTSFSGWPVESTWSILRLKQVSLHRWLLFRSPRPFSRFRIFFSVSKSYLPGKNKDLRTKHL